MKKIFAMLALGMILMSSALASDFTCKAYPEYFGSLNAPGVKIVEECGEYLLVEIDGVIYVVK